MEHPAAHIQLPDRITVSEDIELRLLQKSHAATLFAVVDADRAHLRQWLPWVDSNRDPTDSVAFIRHAREQFLQKAGLTLGIFVRDEIAGVLSLRSFDWMNRSGEIGYWLAKKFVGKGIMLQSCRAVIRHAFAHLGLHRIVIRCAAGNGRSRAIPERLGFQREGFARGAELLNGTFVDLDVYSILSTEWKDQ